MSNEHGRKNNQRPSTHPSSLSPASLLRLKTQWQVEYETWKQRRLDDLEVVYLWVDGVRWKAVGAPRAAG